MYILSMASQSISKLQLRLTYPANFFIHDFIREILFFTIVSSVIIEHILKYIGNIRNEN